MNFENFCRIAETYGELSAKYENSVVESHDWTYFLTICLDNASRKLVDPYIDWVITFDANKESWDVMEKMTELYDEIKKEFKNS